MWALEVLAALVIVSRPAMECHGGHVDESCTGIQYVMLSHRPPLREAQRRSEGPPEREARRGPASAACRRSLSTAGLGAVMDIALFIFALALLALAFWLLLRDLHAKETTAKLEELAGRLRRRQLRSMLKWLRRREQRLVEETLLRLEQRTRQREGLRQR